MAAADTLLYLSREEMEGLGLTAADTVRQIEKLCQGRDAGTVLNAPKSALRPVADVLFMSTLAVAEDPPYMSVKSLGVNDANADRGMETIGALVTLFDRKSAMPVAVMDGYWITAVRTAGLSAVAAKYLARPDAKVAAFVGCGAQAHSHLDAFNQMFPLTEVRALGRGKRNRDRFCGYARSLGLKVTDCANAEETIAGADLIVTSTTISTKSSPFIDAAWVKPGAFASLVDLARPWAPSSMPVFDSIVIDDAEQEKTMPDPMVDTALITGDLQALTTNRIPPRRDERERHAFAFRGLALADLALASLAYDRAVEKGAGTRLPR